jgi:hypothetical protein
VVVWNTLTNHRGGARVTYRPPSPAALRSRAREDRPCLAFHRAAIETSLEGVAQALGDAHAIMVGVCLLARPNRFALGPARGNNQRALHLRVHVP